MHWAVRSKKDLMLEESDQTHPNKVANEEWNEQREIKKEELGSTTEKMEQKESESLEMSLSPQNPDSSSKSYHIALQNREGLRLAKFGDWFGTLKDTSLALTQKLKDPFLTTFLVKETLRYFWDCLPLH